MPRTIPAPALVAAAFALACVSVPLVSKPAAAFSRPVGRTAYCTPDRIGRVSPLVGGDLIRCESADAWIIVDDAGLTTAQRTDALSGALPFPEAVKAAAVHAKP